MKSISTEVRAPDVLPEVSNLAGAPCWWSDSDPASLLLVYSKASVLRTSLCGDGSLTTINSFSNNGARQRAQIWRLRTWPLKGVIGMRSRRTLLAVVALFFALFSQRVISQSQAPSQSDASSASSSAKAQPSQEKDKDKVSCADTGTYVNSKGETVKRPENCSGPPKGATAQCRDGSYSFSRSRRGTCSHHGGVAKWL
jgi:hypothetical protein